MEYAEALTKLQNAERGTGASLAPIQRAEANLQVKLPTSFRAFLEEIGYLESPELTVYGIGKNVPAHLDLLRMREEERKAWMESGCPMPDHLVPISPDGRGGHYCLDTSRMKSGECPVVYWDHELVEPGYRPELTAKSFQNFFKKSLPKRDSKPKTVTLETAIKRLIKTAKKAGIVGPDLWRRGAVAAEIAAAERRLKVKLPSPYVESLRGVDGFEHAGGWFIYGVNEALPEEASLVRAAKELWSAGPKDRHLLPIAKSWVGQLCCLDLNSDPLVVVALREESTEDAGGLSPMPLDRFLFRICDEMDPWAAGQD